MNKVSIRFDEKTLFFTADLSSLFFCVLLSYYKLIRCYQRIKTLLDCLIQATYYNGTTHRAMTEIETKTNIGDIKEVM